MKRKTLFWIGLFAVLAVLGAGIYLFQGGGTVASVYVDGALYRTVDLRAVAAPYTFTVQTDAGWNTVLVEPGRICVSDADCPNRDCVEQGFIADGAIPIVCLPHKLVIRIEE